MCLTKIDGGSLMAPITILLWTLLNNKDLRRKESLEKRREKKRIERQLEE